MFDSDPSMHEVLHAQRLRSIEQPPSFEDLMAEHLRRAPWLVISLAFHALIALILLSIPTQRPDRPAALTLQMPVPEPEEKIEADPIEKPLQPVTKEIVEPQLPDEEVVKEPTELLDDSSLLEDELPADDLVDANMVDPVAGLGGGGPRGRSGGDGHGGTGPGFQPTESRALEWLARHQDADGRWSASEFMKHDPENDVCDGPGNPVNDVGVTGLALLAFLGEGSTMNRGQYRERIRRAVRWLRGQMDEEGLIGSETGHSYMYNHAIAALSMIEAFGLSKSQVLRRHVQKAVNYIQKARNPYKAWRYYPQDGQSDSSVTGWMVFALKSAKEFGLRVDTDALKYSLAFFDECTDSTTGQCGYTKRGEASSRKAGLEKLFPAGRTEALTAVGLLARIFLGQKPAKHPVLLTASDTLLRKKPVWNRADGTIDLYYWYYGTYAMYQIGGRHWRQWKKSLGPALLETQRMDGSAKGSWDPIGAWGEDGGRVYATAMGALTMQVFYRYSRLLR